MNRFLSRREKGGGTHRREKSRDKSTDKKIRPLSSEGFISLFKPDPQRKEIKELSNKISSIKERMGEQGYPNIDDQHINYALGSIYGDGDVDRAVEMVLIFQQSVEGIVKPYDPNVQMLGAVNRGGVTCYLDSLLFSMFSRLGSFEPILHTNFEDEPRRRLAALIRLWVNLLRTGKLIQTDLTEHLQDALVACGWEDAGELEQQDTSEAFSFITGKLELPLLTLKMDIYHTGKEDMNDDHKFVQERLLEVAVPDANESGRPIKLEDCLESYLNNQVEVTRRLERSNTKSSIRSAQSPNPDKDGENGMWTHVEVSELSWSTPDTPLSAHPPLTPTSPVSYVRDRATSIIRHRMVYDDEKEEKTDRDRTDTPTSARKGSLRAEVRMPAWQFFNLIPWYTKHSPANDDEVAEHFSKMRPVLGICLKRYAMTIDGHAIRKDTFIDIPQDIKLPHFVADDASSESGPHMGNFKLSLQSIICHRGVSVHKGHYVSFIRSTSQSSDGDCSSSRRLSTHSQPPHYSEDRWIKFDDLNNPRVQYVDDIEDAMKAEMPYLLFYQVQPMVDLTMLETEPPSYQDSGVGLTFSSPKSNEHDIRDQHEGYFDGVNGHTTPAIRLSTDLERPEEQRKSINLSEERRGSLAFTEISTTSTASTLLTSAPPTPSITPAEETAAQRMSRAAARVIKSSNKSRPSSQSGEGRLSQTLSRLNWRASKEQLTIKVEGTRDKEESMPIRNTFTQMDGAGDHLEHSLGDESLLKTEDEAANYSKSKKTKKRDKSKGPPDIANESGHHNHHSLRGKGKSKSKERSKDVDRECLVM